MGYIPPFSLTDEMMYFVQEISKTLGKIENIEDLNKFPRLRRINRIRSIHSSLAIENNSLTMDQVSDIIEGKRVIGPPDEILEVRNAFKAYEELDRIDPFSMKDMLRTHKIMMNGLDEESGRFRTVNVGVFAGDGHIVHAAPQPSLVPSHVEDLFDWLKRSKTPEIIRSSVFHYEFEFIHPFRDGNGRMGRLWQTAILMRSNPLFAWIPMESIIRERQQEYYNAIRTSTKNGNSNEFILFMLKTILDAIKAIASDAHKHINRMNTRVRDLLEVLEYEPLSSRELMGRLNLRSYKAFLSNYLRPAIEAGLVSLTEPDRPTSRNQKYFRK